jgi:hypothetical protein
LGRETPRDLWAATGIRALDHAVEIYLSRAPTPATDAASLHVVRLLFAHLPRSLEVPTDDEARLVAMQAAWLSMLGVDNVTLGLSHGIGHQIGARCGRLSGAGDHDARIAGEVAHRCVHLGKGHPQGRHVSIVPGLRGLRRHAGRGVENLRTTLSHW